MRSDRKKQSRNLTAHSEIKTLTTKFLKTAKEGKDSPPVREAFRALIKCLDQAASRGIIHRKTASRKKSRLSRFLAKTQRPAS